jgi:hypothetical protein
MRVNSSFFSALRLAVPALLSLVSFAHGQGGLHDAVRCQILDAPCRPVFETGISIVPEASFRGESRSYGDGSMIEFDGMWQLAHFWDVAMGEIDTSIEAALLLFPDSVGLQLPDQLFRLNLDAGWTWRFVGDYGVQVRAKPGMYSDFEAFESRVLSVPVSVAYVQAWNPSLSGVLGVEYRHDFDRRIMPLIGAVWAPSREWRIDARLPESRITFFSLSGWSLFTGFEWQNMTYALREKGGLGRTDLTVDDYRLHAGARWNLNGDLYLSAQIGRIFNRSLEFDGGRQTTGDPERDIDVGEALFLRVALIGPF